MGERTSEAARCEHCGRTFHRGTGPGRPARYCRRSCRQRAFEQRRRRDDRAWSEAQVVLLAARLAEHEDALDRVAGLLEQLRADVDDGVRVDPGLLVDRLERAVELRGDFT